MQNDQIIRQRRERNAKITGIIMTVVLHLCALVLVSFSGLKYIYPPPQEQTFLIDFTEVEQEPVRQIFNGSQPQAEEVDVTKPIELVQRSEAQRTGTKPNQAKEATMGDKGDVEQYEPPREKPIDNRALFHAANNNSDKDTLAAQTASKVSEALKAGHPQGNTNTGKTDGTPNAHLQGRTVLGTLPRPSYAVQNSGVVVVTIWVDQYGTVQKAVAGADGTTVTDSALWQAARKAALGAHFNMSADAPALQQGTITYRFNLK